MSETATISRVYVENPSGEVEGCGVIYLEDLERHRAKVGSGIPLPVSLEYHVGARQQEFVKSYGSCGVPWKYSSVSIRDYIQSIGTEFYLLKDDKGEGTWGGILVKCENLKKLGFLTEESLKHIYTVTVKRSNSQTPQIYTDAVYLNLVGMNMSDGYLVAVLRDKDAVRRDGRFEVGGTKYGGEAQWLEVSEVEAFSGGVVWNDKWSFAVEVDAATLDDGRHYTVCAVGFEQNSKQEGYITGYIAGVKCVVEQRGERKYALLTLGCWNADEKSVGFYIEATDEVVRFVVGHDTQNNLRLSVYKNMDSEAVCEAVIEGMKFGGGKVIYFRIGALDGKTKVNSRYQEFKLEEDSQVGRFDVLRAYCSFGDVYSMKWLACSKDSYSTNGADQTLGNDTIVTWSLADSENGGSGIDCSGYERIVMFFSIDRIRNNTDFIYRFLSRKEGSWFERSGRTTELFGSYGFEMFMKDPSVGNVSAYRSAYEEWVKDDRFKDESVLEYSFRLNQPFYDIFYNADETETTADWYKYVKLHDDWRSDFTIQKVDMGNGVIEDRPRIACRLKTSSLNVGPEHDIESRELLHALGWAVNKNGGNHFHRWTNEGSGTVNTFYPFFVFNYDPALVNRFLGYAQMKGVPTTLAMEKQSPTGYVPCLTREQMILLSELLLPTFDWATGNFDTLEDGKQYFVKFPYDDYLGFLEMVDEIQ